jgi:hypothetical protein
MGFFFNFENIRFGYFGFFTCRLIFALVMVGSECDIDDLTEMRGLLLNSPANEGADPDAAPFSLLALKNFYLSKR